MERWLREGKFHCEGVGGPWGPLTGRRSGNANLYANPLSVTFSILIHSYQPSNRRHITGCWAPGWLATGYTLL